MKKVTSDERRVTSGEEAQGSGGAGGQGEKLSAAMRRWQEKIEAGYSIRPRLRRSRDGYMEWGPALFNAEGEFVQNVRRDTFRKLERLGIIRRPEGEG